MKVGLMGCGVIGGALLRACTAKGIKLDVYDKFKPDMADPSVLLGAHIIFLCLPTPTKEGKQDISAIEDALNYLESQKFTGVVILRSTVLPGTTQNLSVRYPRMRIAHNPEFVTTARPLEDMINQPVVLIGSSSLEARDMARIFWTKFDKKTPIKLYGSATTTETAKYMHNCFLAVKVSFFNDMFELCRSLGTHYGDAAEAALAVGQVGKGHTAVPGPDGEQGYGGMCFPKDMNAILSLCTSQGVMAETIAGAATGNARRRLKPEDR